MQTLNVTVCVSMTMWMSSVNNRAIQVGDLATIKITGFNDETRKGFFGTINRTWGGVQNS